MLPREEWLPDAQALPVGRSERVYHGAEHITRYTLVQR